MPDCDMPPKVQAALEWAELAINLQRGADFGECRGRPLTPIEARVYHCALSTLAEYFNEPGPVEPPKRRRVVQSRCREPKSQIVL